MYHKASIQNVHISSALSQDIMYKYHNTFLLTMTATLLHNGINIFTLKGTTTNSKLSDYHSAMVAQCFHSQPVIKCCAKVACCLYSPVVPLKHSSKRWIHKTVQERCLINLAPFTAAVMGIWSIHLPHVVQSF